MPQRWTQRTVPDRGEDIEPDRKVRKEARQRKDGKRVRVRPVREEDRGESPGKAGEEEDLSDDFARGKTAAGTGSVCGHGFGEASAGIMLFDRIPDEAKPVDKYQVSRDRTYVQRQRIHPVGSVQHPVRALQQMKQQGREGDHARGNFRVQDERREQDAYGDPEKVD